MNIVFDRCPPFPSSSIPISARSTPCTDPYFPRSSCVGAAGASVVALFATRAARAASLACRSLSSSVCSSVVEGWGVVGAGRSAGGGGYGCGPARVLLSLCIRVLRRLVWPVLSFACPVESPVFLSIVPQDLPLCQFLPPAISGEDPPVRAGAAFAAYLPHRLEATCSVQVCCGCSSVCFHWVCITRARRSRVAGTVVPPTCRRSFASSPSSPCPPILRLLCLVDVAPAILSPARIGRCRLLRRCPGRPPSICLGLISVEFRSTRTVLASGRRRSPSPLAELPTARRIPTA